MSAPFYDAPRLTACTPQEGWRLRLRYADGVAGTVCLENLLDIGMFKLFRDPRVFATVRVDPEFGDVRWHNAGIRLDASILYQDLRARGVAPARPRPDAGFQRFMAQALVPVKFTPRRKPK